MSWAFDSREARIRRLTEAAAKIADPEQQLGRRARELLTATTGLSAEGVDYALRHCLETHPSEAEIRALCESVPSAPRAHVLLSANVFVAALRAIALAIAAAPLVEVRVSRREPHMAALLHQGAPGLFRLVEELAPLPSDHVWAYGRDATIAALRGDLPAGIVLHAHGDGVGVVVVAPEGDLPEALSEVRGLAHPLALDVVAFDQRGCLSPRIVAVQGSAELTEELGRSLARELALLEHDIPRGEMSTEELGDQTWYCETMTYVAELLPAGRGAVGIDLHPGRVLLPPAGRVLHVLRVDDLAWFQRALGDVVTAVGVGGSERTWNEVCELWPRARHSPVGQMQSPRLDGPVDRRPDPAGEVL